MSNAASSGVDSSQGGGNEQEVVRIFQSKMDQRRMLVQKIGELEAQYSEHARVYEMLVPMEGSRRAFQLVNGVLVEGTVEEMRPMVEGNREGLKDVLEKLAKQLKDMSLEINAYQEKHKISLRPNEATLPALMPGMMEGGGGGGGDVERARSALAL
jgi:prefoldin subunit 2